jgi:16S rRNA (cytidine1402-2'-O)-methyltransferase
MPSPRKTLFLHPMQLGNLYLIPVPIAEGMLSSLPADVSTHTKILRYYFAENARTARRFLRSLHADLLLEEVEISEIDKHTGLDTNTLKKWLKEGKDIGVMSEAGCPGIADPGADIAAIAQAMGAKVIPVTGPSSIFLALMASGLNGQSFCFNGYLPVKDPARSQKIAALENLSQKENQTQIFIETPYRNDSLLADLLKTCAPTTRICIAKNITGPDSYVRTRTAEIWKKQVPTIGKIPTVFLLLA